MNYLSLLTDADIQYICSVIPQQYTSDYFRRNPKAFSKICPGFRPNALSRLNVPDLLHRNCKNDFISSYIEKTIDVWLSQIKQCLDECKEAGNSKDTAYIETLSECFFSENVALYFKLIEEEHPEAYISLLSSAVTEAKRGLKERDLLKAHVESKDRDVNQLQAEINSLTTLLKSSKAKQSGYITEIKRLKQKITVAEDLDAVVHRKDNVIADLSAEVQTLKNAEKELKSALSEAYKNQRQIESEIRAELGKLQAEKDKKALAASKPLHPVEMNVFQEFLGYNLKDIGASTPPDCLLLLKRYLCNILFQGMPIVINRGTGTSLIKCVSNALVGNTNISTLIYSKEISAQDIVAFLTSDERVVCMDGFIGNYNETELLAMLERNRNKIIFLTLAYDRTLRYIPYEFFRYCHYLNINRIRTLASNVEITEDPSVLEETEAEITAPNPDTRYSPLLEEILSEFGFSTSLMVHKCANISNEQDLCSVLAFDVLPYCVDVLHIAPFILSERLVKYAGDTGRCSFKNLFKEWFAR